MLSYIYNLATDKHKGLVAGLAKAFLYFLSLIYCLIVRILIFIYHLKPYRLNCKVISIGNITLGGTGKTSLVLLIAQYLKQRGHRVVILSRGYKRKVVNHKSQVISHETMGDEPYMLKMNLKDVPVVVDPDRIRATKLAIRDYGADTVILDDGLQQWKIKKDLEVVTIDSTNPFGNGYLIPRGILREPLSYLKQADIFVLTKTNLNPDNQDIKDFFNQLNPSGFIIESIHRPLGFCRVDKRDEFLRTDALAGKNVTLISGIADPDSFENLIASLGINIALAFRFPDHYSYAQKDLENVIRESQKKNIDTIITTEKDAVRLAPCLLPTTHYLMNFLVLRIELKIIKYEQEFYNRLLGLYSY